MESPPPLTPPQGRGTFLRGIFRGIRPEKCPIGIPPFPRESQGEWGQWMRYPIKNLMNKQVFRNVSGPNQEVIFLRTLSQAPGSYTRSFLTRYFMPWKITRHFTNNGE